MAHAATKALRHSDPARPWPIRGIYPSSPELAEAQEPPQSARHENPRTLHLAGGLTTASSSFRLHAATVLVSLLLPACHFSLDGSAAKLTSADSVRQRWTFHWMNGCCAALQCTWLCEVFVGAVALAWTIRLHGWVQHWTSVEWGELLARSALMSCPVSWVLIWLYFQAILSKPACRGCYGEGQDVLMLMLTLTWAIFLTMGVLLFCYGHIEEWEEPDEDGFEFVGRVL
eukprot:TRINITY_DN18659_c0_g1_i2.p1 TRINITY_DN18659_c0_g1~~TRINITY_DN18659_c0_g1_i2.p1  ORF type:complete len:240 (+),score=27.06 TRINITY_DN18659_c0_g1_i2:34-720(+)